MNEHDLIDALEDHVADVRVGAAPLDAMTRGAGRVRRRHGLLGGAAAAAVVAVVAVGVSVVPDGADAGPDRAVEPAQPVTTPPVEADVPPVGFRYVGMGSAAIAVPEDWPRNDVDCTGSPQRTTYSVDTRYPLTCAMLSGFPPETDAVAVQSLVTQDTTGWTPTEVDGVEALRSPAGPAGGAPNGVGIAIPSSGVVFLVSSSIDPSRVEDLVDGIVVLEEHAGVPGLNDLDQCFNDGDRSAESGDVYLQRLEDAGLVAEVVERPRSRACQPGAVSVSPAPGTVLDVGSTVRVTLSR